MRKGVEKRVRITVSLDKPDYDYVKNLARSKGLSFSDIVRLGLKEWIQTRQRKA